jgi:serine/threonine protein kinase/Tol biopolymer transport system component
MPVPIGTKLGTYEVTSHIGSGGMGEVYQAHDSNLGRDVAIKVLPEQFARDPERLARFQREAKLLAALNHPNIATIHGLEQSGETHYLVMELVPGETLAQLIKRDGAIHFREALAIAKQIAEALEAAHEKTIIHRDLKPANVKVTPEGRVKVLDFGLAKAFAAEPSAEDIANSPTLSALPTQQGMIMGTAAYMSPEQARGRLVDKRSDFWSFGCVLYELLTGKQAFYGENTTDILAAVVKAEPDWQTIPANTAPAIQALLRRCLQPELNRRARDAGDLRIQIEEALSAPPSAEAATSKRRSIPLWIAATGVGTVAIIAAWMTLWRHAPQGPAPAVRFAFTIPEQQELQIANPNVAVSPDGRQFAFVTASTAGKSALWVRALDSVASRLFVDTEGAVGPFWSPDSQFIGFFADGKMKKVSATAGGPVQTICAAQGGLGASWGADGTIIFAASNRTPIYRVTAAGGTPEVITSFDETRKQNSHRFPLFLPDGHNFLYTARSDVRDNTGIYIGSLDSKTTTWLFSTQSNAVYTPPGYLLYTQDSNLMARAFDTGSLTLSGEPFALVGGVMGNPTSAWGSMSASADGSVLTHVGAVPVDKQVSWFDRTGKQLEPVGEPQVFREGVRLSPDGKRIAVVIPDADSGNRDIWLMDAAGGTRTRLTTHPANDWFPEWSPDGSQIIFATDRDGASSLYRKATDNSGSDERVLKSGTPDGPFPNNWSADGRFVVLHATNANIDIWVLPMFGDRKPYPLVQTPFNEQAAVFSPDGKWVAYMSNESGANEIYVRPFDKPGKQRISKAGGMLPRWSRDGHELLYMEGVKMMGAAIAPGAELTVRAPVHLFDACAPPATAYDYHYDVSNDGRRFLIRCPLPRTTPLQVNVWVNWLEEVQRRASTGTK